MRKKTISTKVHKSLSKAILPNKSWQLACPCSLSKRLQWLDISPKDSNNSNSRLLWWSIKDSSSIRLCQRRSSLFKCLPSREVEACVMCRIVRTWECTHVRLCGAVKTWDVGVSCASSIRAGVDAGRVQTNRAVVERCVFSARNKLWKSSGSLRLR